MVGVFSSKVLRLVNLGGNVDQEIIWDYFQTDGIESFVGNSKRLNFIGDKIQSNEEHVLNIGVGNGFMESLLQKKGKKVSALDPSSAAIENLKKNLRLSDASAQVGYSQEMPFADSSFDVVIMSEVIEHLDSEILSKTLQEVWRVLRSGGRLIGTVPADENLKENECVCPNCAHVFHRWGHVQEFNKTRLQEILTSQFNQCQISRKFFGDWKLVNWKGKLGYFLKIVMMALGRKGSGENFFFIAQKS
jgi:ubiquinone/menaquinone biosynthesis C-methylase UbiE